MIDNIPSPDAPEFGPIRGDLARLYIEHKADLKLDDWSDEQVVERVDDITSALMACGGIAVQCGDAEWLESFRWFSEACERLQIDQSAVPLHG